MKRGTGSYLLLVCLFLSLLSVDAMAERKRLKKPSEKGPRKPVMISKAKNVVIGYVGLGKLTGPVTKNLQSGSEQLLYGLGLSYEHYFTPKLGLGGDLRLNWLSNFSADELRVFALYRFTPQAPRTVYVKAGLGETSGSEWFLQFSATHIRGALGLISYSSGRIHTRIELSYNLLIYNPDNVHGIAGDLYDGGDVTYIGFDIGAALPLD